ncbi:Dopey, N-terminal-domain-containing protein [Glomus cerebriforme]|uniref:Dopey, N-terminal-domain-containing protein n=1 Tax=Glomus cerebriforme TaxID=658196 RepID=A0A397T473_9GLOM|nr:Dopey, N-terminal-domain-containing protein [Glomus cerebriforme]
MRELEKYRKDPRYKKYVHQVEKILQSFDREVNEWADFIAFLGKLLKAFQAYPQFPVIPKKLVVGKRLAQSLNPALPPGVHQKALEVYDYIFNNIGIEQLADDLPIYSQGLFPFLQYAAMNVKPQLLALYEKFFPLRDRLRPVMKAFISALLPGLEEEGGEFFDKVLSLLDYLSGIVEQSYFLQSMWLILITSPALRIPALNYLSRRMPKITSKEDVAIVLGDDVGIMVRAFSATLEDEHVLVQRAILDLLVTSFPLKVKNVGEIIQQDDLTLLMKSASAVVLRKDMSLNRRLYAWLLGPDEHPEQQIEHFHEYGKNAIVSALRGLFFLDTNDLATAQRPYKILISLMDKWEIGQPIVQELLIDVLWSLKNHVDKSDFGVELIQTANMFLEMIDPYLIWMKLYGLVQDRFSAQDGLDTSALDLVDFVLNSFRMHEDEIEQIHMPLFMTALLCKLKMFANETDFSHRISQTESALLLSLDLLQKIPHNVFSYFEPSIKDFQENTQVSSRASSTKSQMTHVETDSVNEETNQMSQSGVDFYTGMDALKYINDFYLYGNDKVSENIANKQFNGIRGLHLVEELLSAIQEFLHSVITNAILVKNKDITLSQLIVIMDRSCGLLKAVSMRLHSIIDTSEDYEELVSKLFSGEWVFSLLKCCYMVNNFEIIDSSLSTIIHIIIDLRLISPSQIDSKQQIRVIVDTLWSFLAPNKAALHLRAVQLIWSLKDLSQANYVEAVISEYLIQKDPSARLSNFERFGTFWRLSDNFQDTELQFSQPMFLMLDTLRDENPTNRRAGETWLRCNKKSYMRILEPIITILCDSSIMRRRAEIIISVETFQLYNYERPFNQAQVDYIFETLSTICRVGGDSFLKAIRKNNIKPDLAKLSSWLLEEENGVAKTITYSEFFVKTALLYMESEVPNTLSSMNVLNEYIHMHAVDFLNHLISKPKYIDNDLVHLVHDGLLRKILFCIYSKKLDLQSRLIHLLCITIPNVGAVNENSKKNTVYINGPYSLPPSSFDNLSLNEETDAKKNIRSFRTAGSSRFLVKVLLDALSIQYNRPLLQQWMYFIVTSLPYFRHSFNSILIPLIQCICEQLSRWKTEMYNHYAFMADNDQSNGTKYNKKSGDLTVSEWDIITLLNGFEKIVMFCLKDEGLANAGDSSPTISKAYESSLGLSGFGNLFSIDTSHPEQPSSEQKPRDYILYIVFPNIVAIILDIWSLFKNVYSPNRPPKVGTDPFLIALSHTGDRTQRRIMKLLDKLYKNAHAELIEAFVELWYNENPNSNSSQEILSKGVESSVIDVMKVIPGSSPQKIITALLISARGRAQSVQTSRVKKLGSRPNKLSDIVILRFLEGYCDSLELSQPLIEVWPQCLTFVKDYITQAYSYKYLFPALLKFIHKLSDKLCSTVYFEDKKVRRDMQDVYQRIVDYCILISGRSLDQGMWIRRSAVLDGETESVEVTDERESEFGSSVNLISDEKKVVLKSKEEILIDQVNYYLAAVVIPNIKRLLIDQDRIVSLFTNMMYYIIGPVLKNRSSTGVPNVILNIICEISKLPFAYRVWRKEIWDVFIDNKFFNMTPVAAKKWRIIMQTIMTSEKERFPELLGRLSTSPANALFVSKEQESLNRALNLRRLSFVIYCGKENQYLTYLPSIQEKLVELFKLGLSELVHAEIYLTLRILMCRISNHHLSNFWPVILTELVRLFGMFLQKEPIEQPSEVANVFLAACKFLDLLFVLQTNDFQVYEWMFISDTINVINHALEWSPYALMDKLADHLSGQQEDLSKLHLDNIEVRAGSPLSRIPTFSNGDVKRPMLTLKSITSIRQLEFFVRNVSLYVYQSIYTLAKPDFQHIESLLENDMLEYGSIYNAVEMGSIDVGSGEIFT